MVEFPTSTASSTTDPISRDDDNTRTVAVPTSHDHAQATRPQTSRRTRDTLHPQTSRQTRDTLHPQTSRHTRDTLHPGRTDAPPRDALALVPQTELQARCFSYGAAMLYIVGGGGHGSEVADLILRCGRGPAAVADDRKVDATRFAGRGISVSGTIVEIPAAAHFTFGVGVPEVRQKLAPRVPCAAAEPLIDPSAVVSPTAELGLGTQVFWQAAVSPLCRLGEHVLIGHGAAVGHDSVLEDLVCVAPGARISGDVTIGECASIGAGALILPGLRIGDHAIVEAGAVVTRSLESGGLARSAAADALPR